MDNRRLSELPIGFDGPQVEIIPRIPFRLHMLWGGYPLEAPPLSRSFEGLDFRLRTLRHAEDRVTSVMPPWMSRVKSLKSSVSAKNLTFVHALPSRHS